LGLGVKCFSSNIQRKSLSHLTVFHLPLRENIFPLFARRSFADSYRKKRPNLFANSSYMKKLINLSLLLFIIQFLFVGIFAQTEQKAEFVVQTGHSSFVSMSVAFSPDGKFLATGSQDNSIKLWNVETGWQLKSLDGHTEAVNSVAFSPDGKILASGSGDQTIKLWNVENGQEINSLHGHTHFVQSVAFSPDGKTLASGSMDKNIKLWSVETGQEIKLLAGHVEPVTSVVFSPDGKTLASGSWDKTIKLWSVETGREVKAFKGHTHWVSSVAFSPDGKILVSGSSDETIKLWNVETGRQIKSLKDRDITNPIYSVAFSSDGKTLASGSTDDKIRLWNIQTGQQIKSLQRRFAITQSVAFSPDGKILASAGNELWNVETGQKLKKFSSSSSISSIAVSPDGKILASGNKNNIINFWGLDIGQQNKILTDKNWLDPHINSVAFSPDGKMLASGGMSGGEEEHIIKLWNVETGQLIKSLTNKSKTLESVVDSVVFSPDGKTLASGGWDKTVKLWNLETGQLVKTLTGHKDSIKSLAFSVSGKTLASGSSDKTIKLWNVETGQEIKTLTENFLPSSGNTIAFSPDGKTLASDYIYSVKFWNIETGQAVESLTKHTSGVNSVAFSPDGKMLASGSSDRTIKLWDVETKKEIKSYLADNTSVKSVVFTPNGKFIVSGGDDATVKVWNIESGELLATLVSLEKEEWVVSTPEGRFDTNKSLDQIEGLHWVVNNEILKPLPLDVFMRQYYEPNLLQRVLAGEQFKLLPSIADINRVQPKVMIREIKPISNTSDLADITIEVERVEDEVSISATDITKKTKLASGAYDLRLFRDGQLVGVSSAKKDLEDYIKQAPQAIEKDKAAKTSINTEEDKAWRKANDIFKLAGENVKTLAPNKVLYTFRHVKIPQNGKKEIEFTAYAFNSDKVKSDTVSAKYALPNEIASKPAKKGRAVVVSIGVNASENAAYNLRYAANDARNMQRIIGERLEADKAKYSEIVSVPLVSDYDKNGNVKPEENAARKAIIKAVFSLLAGKSFDAAATEIKAESKTQEDAAKLIDALKSVPNIEKIKAIEPEDTLIITYAGHGYADNSGIFYLLPYDIGKDTQQLTTANLSKMISSDELSLWMQDVTASEMIMIIDACHSAAAVQGDGFKPGPMGSRGLGQLAYDKDMKILSATQANNVALELNSLEQGLLSYALLEDGIKNGLADADKDRRLLSNEWLSFAEKRVPDLYQEVKDGKRGVIVDGKIADGRNVKIVNTGGKQKSSLDLQRPSLFDFKRRNNKTALFDLP
jgi:WD40 repeat protein